MTLEEIQLMVIKKVSEIAEAVPQPSGKFFYYDGSGVLKKAPMTEIYNLVSGSQSLGTITTASTIPTEGNVWAFAAPGTYPNAGNITVSENTLGILTRVGTTWSKVEVAFPNAVDNVTANGTTAVNSKAVIDYAEPKNFYPYAQAQTTVDTINGSNALLEVYIRDYDGVAYDYILRTLRRNVDISGLPPNRSEITINAVTKGTTNIVKTWTNIVYDNAEGNGLQMWELGDVWVLIDWNRMPNKTGYALGANIKQKLSDFVGDLNANPLIKERIYDFRQGDFQNVIVPKNATQINLRNQIVKQGLFTTSGFAPDPKAESVVLPTEDVWLYITGIKEAIPSNYRYLDANKNPVGQSILWNEHLPFKIDTNYPFVAINLKTSTTTFYQPKIFKKSDDKFEIDKINGLPVSSGNSLSKADADTYYEPIGSAYTKAQSDAKYLATGSALTTSQSDSRYQPIGNVSSSDYKFIDARDFGFLPTNTSAQNVTALQNALNGGNKTVTVSTPGIYKLKGTVWIDSNTEIQFGKGVIIEMVENTWNLLCNRNAPNRLYDENITISGLKVTTNGFKASPVSTDALFGMRGIINFFYIKKLRIFDYEILDITDTNWAVHICNFDDFIIDRIKMKGMKDGIHMGRGRNFVIRNIDSSCYDDTVGLNASDYWVSSPEVGDIENGVIENIVWRHDAAWNSNGRIFNMYAGAQTDWFSGIPIMHGDSVIVDGKIYRAFVDFSGTQIPSTTKPTSTTFTDVQSTPEGITWKLSQNDAPRTANIKNVWIRNLVDIPSSADKQPTIINALSGNESNQNRSVHPSIPVDKLPEVSFTIDGIRSKRGVIRASKQLGVTGIVSRWTNKAPNEYTFICENTDRKSYWLLKDNDFRGISGGINFGNNADIILSNNIQLDTDALSINSAGSRVQSNTNLSNSETTFTPKKGDEIKVNGVKKIYTGSAWNNIN